MAIKHNQMATLYSKWALNVATFSIPKPSKSYPKCNFWFENIPSGNPDMNVNQLTKNERRKKLKEEIKVVE
jgi:hypothetical protein